MNEQTNIQNNETKSLQACLQFCEAVIRHSGANMLMFRG